MDYAQSFVEVDSIVTHSKIKLIEVGDTFDDSFHLHEETQRLEQQHHIEASGTDELNLDHHHSQQHQQNHQQKQQQEKQGRKQDESKVNEEDGGSGSVVAILSKNILHKESLRAANDAACDYFLGKTSNKNEIKQVIRKKKYLIDSKRYKQKYLPVKDIIEIGDLIVIQEAFGKLSFVYVRIGDIYSNRNGHFHHTDFIGKRYGCKIRSRNNHGFGFIYLLRPTTELWTKSLVHRTQIVHELDQSQIIYQLYIRPGSIVIESGTGSGAVSYSISRTIAPTGHLHSYEFNEHRYHTARVEFQKNNLLSKFVTVYHRDVCTNGFTDNIKCHSVDAIFLDLPEPHLTIKYATKLLKLNSRIASYSPCIEQTQRMVQELEQYNFHSVQTYEYRLQEYYVDEVEYGLPPTFKRSKPAQHDIQSYTGPQPDGVVKPINMKVDDKPLLNKDDDVRISSIINEGSGGNSAKIHEIQVGTPFASDHCKSNTSPSPMIFDKKRLIVARPFTMMRGHTAFLTFATFGGTIQETSESKEMKHNPGV